MARHRINENGHMMWFDNDEEYRQYQKRKAIPGIIFGVVFGVCAIFAALGHKQEPKEAALETTVTQSSSEEKNFVQSVKQQVQLDKEIEDLTIDQNTVIDANEEGLSEEREEYDEEIIEDHEIAIVEEEDFSNQIIYDIVDEMPVFPGGDHELIRYIEDNLDYPKDAMESGIEGRVFVKIIVEPNGSISNAKIIRGLGYGCDEEAVRVVESMPNWKAGRKNGETVRVNMAVPVNFKLQ